jgi:hypothetical protein
MEDQCLFTNIQDYYSSIHSVLDAENAYEHNGS